MAFSPDETKRYVADSAANYDISAPRHIRVFDVADGKKAMNSRVFRNIWSSARDGVHRFAPDGTLIGKIKIFQTVANFTFGGPRRDRLSITATQSFYRVYTTATGVQLP